MVEGQTGRSHFYELFVSEAVLEDYLLGEAEVDVVA